MSCACANGPSSGSCCKSGNNAAVALPKAKIGQGKKDASQQVWAVEAADQQQQQPTEDELLNGILGDAQPLSKKCAADGREGQCCKDLKGDDERNLISPEIVRDVIIGLSDGLTVPFALTAGLSSLGSSRLVVTGGLAELCAGAISMGLGGYLASQAEMDHFHYLRRQTQARVLRSCAGEMQREVHAILGPLGVKEPLSRLVAENLRSVEDDMWSGGAERANGNEGIFRGERERPSSPSSGSRQGAAKKRSSWWKIGGGGKDADEEVGGDGEKGDEDMGLTAFLLKFGEGMEEVPPSRLYISAITIGMSYFIGGLIPLIPYMADVTAETGLIISSAVTVVVLFIFGGFKTYFTGATGGWGGYLYGATSTMVVGALAAGAAFGLVKALGVQE